MAKQIKRQFTATVHSLNSVGANLDEGASSFIEGVFKLHNKSLLRFLTNKLGSVEEAQDVSQEVYLKLLRIENLDFISHVKAYLFRTANNIAIDRLRRRNCSAEPRQFQEEEQENLPGIPLSVERSVEADKRLQLIGGIVASLPPKCRQAFLLYKFEGLSYKEIASRMRLTESMIRKYVLRAICYCQERMEGL